MNGTTNLQAKVMSTDAKIVQAYENDIYQIYRSNSYTEYDLEIQTGTLNINVTAELTTISKYDVNRVLVSRYMLPTSELKFCNDCICMYDVENKIDSVWIRFKLKSETQDSTNDQTNDLTNSMESE